MKAGNGDIVLLDMLSMEQPKTKDMVALMERIVGQNNGVLLLLAGHDENVEKSARNLPKVKTLRAHYLNIRDLLGFGKIVMPLSALEVVKSYLSDAAMFDDADWDEEE